MTVPIRVKKDVLKDLSDKLEEVRYVQMGKEQQKLYDAEVLRMKKDLSKQTDEDLRKGKPQVLAAITRIRQICCDPSLCFDGYKGESAKREAVMDLIPLKAGSTGLNLTGTALAM